MTTPENEPRDAGRETQAAKSHRVTTVAWLAGITAVVALWMLSENATTGMGLGVLGVAAMVGFVCARILKD